MSGFLLQAMSRRRAIVILLACLAVVAPLALQLAHVIPPSYGAHDGRLVLIPHLTKFSPRTPLVLAAVQVSFIVSACVFYRRFRDLFQRAEERVYVNAWQLRQLVPIEAYAAMSIPPSPGEADGKFSAQLSG